jgi:hypothetical protein
MKLAGMLCLLAACTVRTGGGSGSCGVEVKSHGADGDWVRLEIANVTDHTVEIGGGIRASFVDADGVAMEPQMTPDDDSWFMSFRLPAHSHRDVKIQVKGGDPSHLARLEVPNSGDLPIPRCTIAAAF